LELKDFVRETLTQISEGVQESLVAVRKSGGYVNPATRTNAKNTDSSHFSSMQNGQQVFLVDFDVAITVEEDTGTNAHAKLKVASILSLGVGGESGNKSSATNHISFKVPMALPVDSVTQEELKKGEQEQSRKLQNSIDAFNNIPM
jgi:hypothetical protein